MPVLLFFLLWRLYFHKTFLFRKVMFRPYSHGHWICWVDAGSKSKIFQWNGKENVWFRKNFLSLGSPTIHFFPFPPTPFTKAMYSTRVCVKVVCCKVISEDKSGNWLHFPIWSIMKPGSTYWDRGKRWRWSWTWGGWASSSWEVPTSGENLTRTTGMDMPFSSGKEFSVESKNSSSSGSSSHMLPSRHQVLALSHRTPWQHLVFLLALLKSLAYKTICPAAVKDKKLFKQSLSEVDD